MPPLLVVCASCALGLSLAGRASDDPSVADGDIQQLTAQLKNDDPSRQKAAEALGKLGPQAKAAVPALIEAVKEEEDDRVLQALAAALGEIGNDALEPVMELLKDQNPRVRAGAAYALGTMGPDAKVATPALSKLLQKQDSNDPNDRIRKWTARALGQIGPGARDAVPVLLKSWKDPDMQVAAYSEDALDIICQKDHSPLIAALAQEEPDVRAAAAEYLGKIGPGAADAIPRLVAALKDSDGLVRHSTAKALAEIVAGADDTKSIPNLKTAVETLPGIKGDFPEQEQADYDDQIVKPVKEALERLENQRGMVARWLGEPWAPWVLGVVTYIGALLALWAAVLWLRPLWLLQINDALRPYTDFQLPERYGNLKVSVRTLLLVGFFNYRPRVLDAWIARRVITARKTFLKIDTVQERAVFVPAPVSCDGVNAAHLTVIQLRPTFARNKACLLIWGEGGVGKTSLACQVMKAAMAEDRDQRLCDHVMLPVIIQFELDFAVEAGNKPFEEAIRGQLQALIDEGEPIPEELFRRLLRTRRLLVCVDRFSEMSETTRRAIRPGDPDFPVNALIVTSRKREPLDDVPRTTIQPLLVEGNRLSSFMEAYLTQREKRQLFDDAEYFEACRRLSLMVGGRKITALLAKLYAEQLIDAKEGRIGELPDNIPDLMLTYLNELNRGAPASDPDDLTVHCDLKVIAWECLRETHRPQAARRDAVLAAMRGTKSEQRLQYLEDRLRIVKTIGAGRDHIRVVLDPLAEYLAGLHLVETYRANEQLWREFLARADSLPAAGDAVRGFLLAVRDCCLAKGREAGVPEFVERELTERASVGS